MCNLKFLFSIVFSFFTFCAFAQNNGNEYGKKPGDGKMPVSDIGSISGKVTDEQGKPISYATVTLLRLDSSIVNGDLTKDNGSFSIAPTGTGKFKLRIETIGATTKFISVEITNEAQSKDVGKIKLLQKETSLKSVTVTGEKPIMELKVDKKVFNVEKNITSAGGSASDVLQNVPAVSVDADGNVSLRGKTDVTILIDGKPATMLGTDVASALQSLPAGSIDNIEVITNPSAKYDAQGTSGIINIVTKKDSKLGINGTATLGAGTNDKYNGNFGLNVRKGKWNVFANSSFRLNSTYNDVYTERYDKDSLGKVDKTFNTYEHVPRRMDGSFNSIGATFDPDKYNSFTVTQNINFMHFGFKDLSNYLVYDNPLSQAYTFNQSKYTAFDVNLMSLSSAFDYKHKFKKKDEELTTNFTYASTAIKRDQSDSINVLKDVSIPVLPATVYDKGPNTGNNNTITISADYTNPLFTKNGKMGIGFKTQIFSFKSSSDSANTTKTIGNNLPVLDTALYTVYNYTKQVNAGYINWNDQIEKFSYQVGVRAEQLVYNGSGKIPTDTTYSSTFLNLFPSAFVSYQLPKQQSIYLNYSRRTNYPDPRTMMPFKDYSNPSTVSMGNPNLIPEFINNFEFSYNKSTTRGDNFIVSLYYAHTQNLMQRITRLILPSDSSIGLKQETGKMLTQSVNIYSGTTYGLEGTGHFQFNKWWDATVNLNFFQNELVIGKADPAYDKYLSNSNGFSWFGKANTSVKLPKSFSIQLNVNYESPKVIAQGNLHETWWADLAIRKNMWKNKATVILNCSDIFNSHIFGTVYDMPAYYENINRVKETRIVNLTLTYRFGKTDFGKQGQGQPKSMMRGGEEKSKQTKPTEKERENNLKDNEDNGGEQGGGGNNGGGQKK